MTARIGLVHPPPADSLSGGDLYNRRLLDAAAARGFPLLSVPWRDRMPSAANQDLLVWDSLLLDRCTRLADEGVALLLHYLPSLDPALEAADRIALEAVEQRAIAAADFVIATGGPVAEALTAFEPVLVNGELGLVNRGRPAADGRPGFPPRVTAWTVRDGRIWAAYDMANPEKLRRGVLLDVSIFD